MSDDIIVDATDGSVEDMSLFGYFVVGRADGPLSELGSVRRVCEESGTLAGTTADGEWQFTQIFDGSGLRAPP